jgi:O-antigen/teichoic acid export membrane protein
LRILIKGGLYRILFMGFNFLTGLFIAAISGTEIFGIISLMVVNAAVFSIVSGLGADSAIVWHGASQKLSREKLFSFAFFSAFFQVLLFLIVSLLFYKMTHKLLLSQQHFFSFYVFELIYFSGLILIDKYTSLFYASHRMEDCNKLLSGVTLVCLVLIVLIRYKILNLNLHPFSLLCLTTFIQAVGLAILFHTENNGVRIVRISTQDLRSLFNFSMVVFITNLVQFFAYRADYWLINYFKGESELGIFSQANRFAQMFWVLPNILAAMLIPLMAAPADDFDEKGVVRLVRVVNYLNLLAIGVIVLIALLAYELFLPSSFSAGFFPLLLMMPGCYFFCINILLAAFFSSRRLLWVNFIGSSICFVVIIITDLFLIPAFGIRGAAIADSIAYSAATVFSIISFMRHTSFSFADLFMIRRTDWTYWLAYKTNDQ